MYSNVEVRTSTGQGILTTGGLQIAYPNMASFGLVTGAGGRNDATGARTSRVVLVTAAGETGESSIATVSTDWEDYSPGETVIVTGGGWEPGETVSLLFHEDVDPPIHPDQTLTAVADGNGQILNQEYVIDEADVGIQFILTATGLTSGRTAQTTFTDGNKLQFNTAPFSVAFNVCSPLITVQMLQGSNPDNGAPTPVTLSSTAGGTFYSNAACTTAVTSVTIPTSSSTASFFYKNTTTGSPVITAAAGVGCSGGNCTVTQTETITGPDLTITKTHVGNFAVGIPASYTITVTNPGTAATSGTVTVTDVQPAGLTFTGATGTGWTCGGSTTITCTRSNALASGASYPTITLNVTPTAAGTVTNVATVSGGGEANTGNDSASDPTTVLAAVDLTINKSHTGDFTLGVNGSYTLMVTNGGGTATSGTVTVTDVLPAGLGFVSASGTAWTCGNAAGTVTCTRTTAINASATAPNITLTVSVAEAAFPTVTNSASVSGGGEPAANNGNNSDSDATTVVAPELTIAKSHTGNFTQGVNGAYSLVVSNGGGAATTGTVTVTDVLPTGLGFVSATGGNWTCGVVTATVTCTRTNSIAAGGNAQTITLTVSVAPAAIPSVTNTASVSGGGEPAASNGNNSDSDPTTVVAGVDLTIDKSHTGNFTEGVNGTYSLAVSNAGGVATNANVTVTDVLPTGLGFVSGTGTGWNACTAAAQTVTCVRPAANVIAAAGSAPAITLTVSVGAAAVPSVTNTASVAGGGEPAANNGNNSDSDPTTVIAGNVAPLVNAGGPYTGDEGSAIPLNTATATDADAGDTPTYKWTYVANGAVDAGTTCSFSNDAIVQPSFTCNDDGAFTVTLTVNDGHGHIVADDAGVTVANVKPTATAGGPYTGSENAAIQLGGTGDDPAANDDDPKLTYKWTVNAAGIDAGGACTFDDDTKKNAKVTCTDDGAFTVTLVATDDDGAASTGSTANLTVSNANPVADAGGPYSGDEGSAINLVGSATDAGPNDAITYKWTADVTGIDAGGSCAFGDDTQASTTVTCTDNGAFKVKLTATDDDGGSHFEEVALTVANVEPVADAGGPYNGNEGAAISLNGTVTDAGSNDTHTWSWQYVAGPGVDAGATCQFDDATAEDPKITCTDDGQVKLTLTVNDDNGGTGVDEATLTLANVAPTANAHGPYSGDEGAGITLAGTATDPAANDVISYKWTANVSGLDAGASCSFDDDTKRNADVTCTDDGTVTLTLKATDDDNEFTTSNATLTVLNVDPVPHAGGPYTGNEGAAVNLSGSVTDAGANDTHLWSWQYLAGPGVDAGATCQFSDPTAMSPTVTCTDDGQVKLTLKATDDDGGEGTAEATLTLANVAPVAHANGPYPGIEGTALQLNGTATDAGSNDTFTYLWTVSTAGIDAGGACTFDNASLKNAKVTCTDDGAFTLTLKVTDDDNDFGTEQTTLTVANASPVAVSGGPYTGNEGAAVTLNGSATDPGSNDPLTYLWTANAAGIDGGGSCSFDDATRKDAKVTCTDNGSATLTLTASDDDGGSNSVNTTLTLQNVKPTLAMPTAPDGSALATTIIVAGTLNIKVPFSDPATNDTHKAQIDCGSGYVNVNGGADVATGFLTSCTFATVGTKTIKIKVTDDDAGYDEKTHTLTVKYNFIGFSAPVDRPTTQNISKAGQAIPLKWQLLDANGVPVTNLTAVDIKISSLSCGGNVPTDLIEEYASGASGLNNKGGGNYQFNWKTPTNYTGTCKNIGLDFGGGYVEVALAVFNFKS